MLCLLTPLGEDNVFVYIFVANEKRKEIYSWGKGKEKKRKVEKNLKRVKFELKRFQFFQGLANS